MPLTTAVGSDGSVTLPTGFNAALNTWSATLTRSTQVTTAFAPTSNAHNRRASKVLDITGSAGGFPFFDDGTETDADGSIAPIKHSGTALDDRAGGTVTLFTVEPSATRCSIAFAAVFSSFAFGVAQDGASTVTFNFEMNQSTAPTVTWDQGA